MIESLTDREREVADLLMDGLSNKLIADKLDIADHTAKFHIANFMKKFKSHNRTEAAVKYALAKERNAT